MLQKGKERVLTIESLGIEGIAIVDRHTYPAGDRLNDGKLNFDYQTRAFCSNCGSPVPGENYSQFKLIHGNALSGKRPPTSHR